MQYVVGREEGEDAMTQKLEDMLRLVLMNQTEIMAALDELLGEEPETEEDEEHRAELRANLTESIEQTLEVLKGSSRTERLCLKSSVSGLPWRVVPEDSVEGGEELSHDRDKGDLLRSPSGDEPVVEGPKGGMAADGSERRHV